METSNLQKIGATASQELGIFKPTDQINHLGVKNQVPGKRQFCEQMANHICTTIFNLQNIDRPLSVTNQSATSIQSKRCYCQMPAEAFHIYLFIHLFIDSFIYLFIYLF